MARRRNYTVSIIALIIVVAAFYWENGKKENITKANIKGAEQIADLSMTRSERDSMLDNLESALSSYQALRELKIDNAIAPALVFDPRPAGFSMPTGEDAGINLPEKTIVMPETMEELAFYSVGDLGHLVRTKQVTSVELTTLFLNRLKKYGDTLECVITLTEVRALENARIADNEIAQGIYRGPLHGIPFGAKDLLAVPGYKTTWGATPFKDQTREELSTVVEKLDAAGAILVAKLTMGALAWGDVWYGGKTKNPWNLEQGSSGSSAGSASATSAGLVPFAIGTETWGSIVSPSTRCGTTGLRPTFGRVSRYGAMALSWSMDKIGPICRSVDDCAIVFNTIRGTDGKDNSVVDAPFNYPGKKKISDLKVGFVVYDLEKEGENDTYDYSSDQKNYEAVLNTLRNMGISLVPITLPEIPFNNMAFILGVEAAAAFDDLTLSNKDDELVRQVKNAWPNEFRSSRFVPAVEYIQANRARNMLIDDMAAKLENLDLYITASFSDNLLMTNLTGHPCVVLPNGFNKAGSPTSITFMGHLYDEATVLDLAKSYQDATNWHLKTPPIFTP